VNFARFKASGADSRRQVRERLGIGERFAAVYVGSFGGWYLTEETADFFGRLKLRKPDSFALILTQSKPEMIEPLLRERGYGDGDYFIRKIPPVEIPEYLSAADIAISFIKPCYSKQASSPTKNAEYLACGLPMVVNDGIGDTTRFTEADGVGAVISEFTDRSFDAAIDEIDELLKDGEALGARCRESAESRFDLATVAGERYRRIYRRLLETVE
jgi:glycosyltransferase involved in cell wall biosynthesis